LTSSIVNTTIRQQRITQQGERRSNPSVLSSPPQDTNKALATVPRQATDDVEPDSEKPNTSHSYRGEQDRDMSTQHGNTSTPEISVSGPPNNERPRLDTSNLATSGVHSPHISPLAISSSLLAISHPLPFPHLDQTSSVDGRKGSTATCWSEPSTSEDWLLNRGNTHSDLAGIGHHFEEQEAQETDDTEAEE
jgi:hypothetical protein